MNSIKSESFIDRLAAFLVDKRNLIFLLYIFAFIFCIFSRGWVKVENDVTVYLPEDTETRQGLVAMSENFTTNGSAQIMVSNVSLETAQTLADELAGIEGLSMVTFDDTQDHYRDASALYDITFSGESTDPVCVQAQTEIE